MPNKDFQQQKHSVKEIFNFLSVDVDDDGDPDAIGVCNWDGSSVGTAATILDDMEDVSVWGLISGYAGDTLALSDTHKIGAKSLSFNKIAGNVLVGAERQFTIPKDLGVAEATRKSIQFMCLIDTTDVVNVWLRLGTDDSNYSEIAIPKADLTSGAWNRITVHLLDQGWAQTGTGLNTANLVYMAVGAEFSAAGDTLAGILFDNVVFLEHVEVESKVLVTTTVTSGTVKLQDGDGASLLDVETDSAKNAAFVQSESLASEATLSTASAKLPATLGQKAMAASLAVAIASDQSMVPVGNNYDVIDECDATTGWTAAGDVANFAIETDHLSGQKSLKFDKVGAGTSILLSRTITSKDLSNHSDRLVPGLFAYIPDVTNLTSINLRLGTDASNYSEWSFDSGFWQVGWNRLEGLLEDIVMPVTGNGLDQAAVTYVAVEFIWSLAGQTDTDFRIDQISVHKRLGSEGSVSITPSGTRKLLDVMVRGPLGQTTKAASVPITRPSDDDEYIVDTDHHQLDTFDATTGWAGSTDVSGLATSDDNFDGNKALTFDKSGTSETLGSIIKTITSVDLKEHVTGHLVQAVIKLPSVTNVDYAFIKIGTDASNYTEYQWQVADLLAAWNVLSLNITGREDPITGTGIDSSAITYLEVGVVMNAIGNTLSGIVVDSVDILHSLEANLRESPTTEITGPINLGSVTLKDRNSSRQADIEADGSENALHVMSNSMATAANQVLARGTDPPVVSDAAWTSGVYVKAAGGGAPSNVDIGAGAPTGRWHIVDLHPSVGAATILTLTEETSGTVIEKWNFGANGGTRIGRDPRWPDRMPTAAKKLLVTSSADVDIYIKFRMYDA
jgi:hypothetical protein